MLTTKKWVALRPVILLATLGVVLLNGCQPSGPRSLREGARLVHAGRYSDAVARLEVATRLLPQNAEAWNYLGLAYHGARQANQAAQAYQQALLRDRNLAAARFNLGCLYAEQNNLAAAIPELTTYTLLQPQAVGGWLQLGLAQLRARQLAAAENSFLHARQLEPANPEALNNLGLIQLRRNRARDAYAYFHAALQQQPRYAPALWNTAITADYYLKNHAFALERFREYVALAPHAANRADADERIRQLTIELHPPPHPVPSNTIAQAPAPSPPAGPATPLPSATLPPKPTNPPVTVAQSSATLTRPAPRTADQAKPAPSADHLAPPVATPKEGGEPKPVSTGAVEVVRLPDEPPVRPAAEIEPATKSTASSEPSATAPTAASDTFNPPSRVIPAPERSGFFQRLNPGRWFRRRTDSDSRPAASTPAPSKPAPKPPPAPAPSPARPETPPVLPQPARYAYLSPTKPAPGNRSEALTFLTRGADAYRDGRTAAALAAYRQAAAVDPAFFEAQYNLALAAFEAGELPRSLSAGELALAIRPDSVDARYNFALALQQANYPRDAAEELEKILAAHPEETRAHLTLANLYAQPLRQPRLARTHYLKVLALSPEHPQATAIRYWLAANPP